MVSLPNDFKQLLASSTLLEKRAMLIALSDSIHEEETSTTNDPPKLTEYVHHIPSFLSNDVTINGIISELDSLKLTATNTRKLKTAWLNSTDEAYPYTGSSGVTHLIQNYPFIKNFMDMLNSNELREGHLLNSCLVACYSTSKKSLSLHADDEKEICQFTSICNLSLGASRTIEFLPKSGSCSDDPVCSFDLDHGSLNIMRPGCQQVLKHRIPPGQHHSNDNKVRYSISFRRFISSAAEFSTPPASPFQSSMDFFNNLESEPGIDSPNSSPDTPHTTPRQCKLVDTVLFAGDSHFSKLNTTKLGKNKINVINISKGGQRINETERSISEFYSTNSSNNIVKVFLSVGTNDIRYCTRGIQHLTKPLKMLSQRIKLCFPKAQIFYQSLLPLPIINYNVRMNVESFNKLLFETCKNEKIFYFDVFDNFLDNSRHRDPRLFENDINNVHLNSVGLGILAKRYIYKIHNKRFNPRLF